MPLLGKNPQAEAQPQILPLFRPEAMAEQERTYGDVLRIRPLSLFVFIWLAAAVAAGTVLYLVLVVGKK